MSLQDRIAASEYPLLRSSPEGAKNNWRSEIGGGYFPFLKDHVVNHEVVFPGAGYVEAGLEAFRKCFDSDSCIIRDLEFHNILFVKQNDVQFLYTVYEPKIDRFEVYGESSGTRKLQASGYFVNIEASDPEPLNLSSIQENLTTEVPIEDLYLMLEERGLHYGPDFQRADRLFACEDEFLAKIDASIQMGHRGEYFLIHPAVLDTAIHCKLSIVPGNTPFVPVSIKKVILRRSIPESFWCYGVVTNRTSEIVEANLFFVDEGNQPIGELIGLRSQKLDNRRLGEPDNSIDCLYEPKWIPQEAIEDGLGLANSSRYLFVSRDDSTLNAFRSVFESHELQAQCVVASPEFRVGGDGTIHMDLECSDHYEKLFAEISIAEVKRAFFFGSLNATDLDLMIEDCASFSCFATQLSGALDAASLTVVTRGVYGVGNEEGTVMLDHAPLSGLARLAGNEFGNLTCSLIDLPENIDSNFLELKTVELVHFQGDELALRSDGNFERTLVRLRSDPEDTQRVDRMVEDNEPYELAMIDDGSPEMNTALIPLEKCAPSSDQVEVAVHYACLSGLERVCIGIREQAWKRRNRIEYR